jgi:hypothetical protein
MCFVLYAGTSRPLPRKTWQKENPDISVESLTERDAPIKTHFSTPEVQYIGSTSGCGCDFPHATFQNGEWPEIDYQEDLEVDQARVASDKHNREALVDLLRKSGESAVELYGIWEGDFAELPANQEKIAADRILDSTFRFKERGFYRVVLQGPSDVM